MNEDHHPVGRPSGESIESDMRRAQAVMVPDERLRHMANSPAHIMQSAAPVSLKSGELRGMAEELLSRRSANSAGGGVKVKAHGQELHEFRNAARAVADHIDEFGTFFGEDYDRLDRAADVLAKSINVGSPSLHPTEGEPVAWVTADILAAMKRGERAVPGWKQSDDFCIPLYAGTRPSNPVSAEVTEEQMVAFRTEFDRWDEGFTTKPRCYMVYRKDDAGEFEVMSKHEDRATMEAALFSARTRAALMASINGGRENG